MSWNHRILVFPDGDDVYMQMYEVYYDEKGKPNSYGANGAQFISYSIEGFSWLLEKYNEALNKPFLWGDERFPEEYKK